LINLKMRLVRLRRSIMIDLRGRSMRQISGMLRRRNLMTRLKNLTSRFMIIRRGAMIRRKL